MFNCSANVEDFQPDPPPKYVPKFTHEQCQLKTADTSITTSMHISHLWDKISAYSHCKELEDQLVKDLRDAVKAAKEQGAVVVDSLDGEMFFMVYGSGMIALCLRWKEFKFVEK